jgi:hypothetical protein
MPVYNAKSIPAEVHSSTKDPEVAAFLKTGPVLGAHKPIHAQRVEHNGDAKDTCREAWLQGRGVRRAA